MFGHFIKRFTGNGDNLKFLMSHLPKPINQLASAETLMYL